jgi:carboxypeptidase Q
MLHRCRSALFAVLLTLALPVSAQWAPEPVDLDAIYRLKDEGFERSKVMETLSFLTDIHGPRLTNSPGQRAAALWTLGRLKQFGIPDARLESWGPFGRGWANERTAVHVTSPGTWPVVAFSKAWAPGTAGVVTGDAVHAPIETDADIERFRGQLKGRFVLLSPRRTVASLFAPPARRFTDDELRAIGAEVIAATPAAADTTAVEAFRAKRMAFLVAEGAVGILEVSPGDRGDNLTVRVQGPQVGEGTRDPKSPPPLPHLVVAAEHYHRMLRALDVKEPVRLEVNVQNRYYDDSLDAANIVAEIAGTDRRDELVLVGSHFDSWHAGTGATDNAVSAAVVIEAMRILKASGVRLRRTVRMVLWTGEEQGLLGSRAYVTEHFGARETMALKPAHAKVAAYFNQDNGGGGYRGIYLQGNEAVAPIFEAWMKPFHNLGMNTLSIRDTGGTDHLSFNAVGLPGFQFIQDPLDYGSWTHHTQQDLYERVNPQDCMKNAVILASFVYHAANRAEMLPRKPVPAPQPAAAPPAGAAAPR